jgi:hypothetical protein
MMGVALGRHGSMMGVALGRLGSGRGGCRRIGRGLLGEYRGADEGRGDQRDGESEHGDLLFQFGRRATLASLADRFVRLMSERLILRPPL